MKFVKPLLVLLSTLLLAACASKVQIPLAGQQVDLKDTSAFYRNKPTMSKVRLLRMSQWKIRIWILKVR